jgi:hypothetical protein
LPAHLLLLFDTPTCLLLLFDMPTWLSLLVDAPTRLLVDGLARHLLLFVASALGRVRRVSCARLLFDAPMR